MSTRFRLLFLLLGMLGCVNCPVLGEEHNSGTQAEFNDTSPLVMPTFGANGFHEAVIRYIRKYNVTHYVTDLTYQNKGDRHVVTVVAMLADLTDLRGINAALGSFQGIDAVAAAPEYRDLTVIINASYVNDNTPDHGFFKSSIGKLVHQGKWDESCSVPSPEYSSIFSRGSGTIALTAGEVPEGAAEGSGGLRPAFPNGQPFTSVSRVVVRGVALLYVAACYDSHWATAPYNDYLRGLQVGADPARSIYLLCDGGTSTALAVRAPMNDGGGLVTKVSAPSHQTVAMGLKEGMSQEKAARAANHLFLKTYLGFKATKPRSGEPSTGAAPSKGKS